MSEPLRIVALISGGGTTVINILDHIEEGKLEASIELVVSSREKAKGLERSKLRGIETAVVASDQFRAGGETDWSAMSSELNKLVMTHDPDLIILAGFMCHYTPPQEMAGKVMNIHPALIPSFCGKGMWGRHVHEAVAGAGVKVSGCTVHFVNDEYDAGPIIVQRACPVYDSDSVDDIQRRVFREECMAYPEAIRLFAQGRLQIEGNTVRIQKG